MPNSLVPGTSPKLPAEFIPGGSRATPAADAAHVEDVIDLREILAVLRRHVGLVAGITILVTAVAGWLAYRTKPVWRANAVIRIADTRNAMTAGIDNPVMPTPTGVWIDPVLSQIQVLESRGVAREVVERHPMGLRVITEAIPGHLVDDVQVDSLAPLDTIALQFSDSGFTADVRGRKLNASYGVPVMANGVSFRIAQRPGRGAGELIVVSREEAIDEFLRHFTAQARKNTDVIDVSYQTTDPVIARQVVNTAVTAFQQINAGTAQQESHRRRVFVQEQLAQTDSILAAAQLALSNFASKKQVYGADQKIAAEQSGLLDLSLKRGELAASRRMYSTLLDSLARANGREVTEKLNAVVSSPGIADNPVVQALYQQLAAYEAARDSLTIGVWGSAQTNPDVQRLNSLVATTEQRLTSAARSQIDALDARISALDELKEQTAAALQKLPAAQAAEARLVQRVDATRKVADQLREEYQKARIAEAVEAGQVEIVDHAPLPLLPIGRGPLFKTLLGLIVGVMLGVGGAFLAESLNTAIRRRDEIEQVLRVPGLAIIPQILPANGRRGRLRVGSMSLPIPTPRLNGARSISRAALVAATDTRSSGAEAFRNLRTSLIFSQAVQALRTIVITSPSPQDGKTTTAANLAVTFAQQGLRVVLVDCDLRRARLHQVFGVAREPGLTNLMLGQHALEKVVRPTLVDNLSFVAAGALPPNPSEMLGGPQMKTVLEQLTQSFDIILLDTPPVHVAADALILGRGADGVLLVVRAGHTVRDSAQDAMHRLANVGARVVGAVLNDPDHKVAQYGGYYYYDYYGPTEEEAGPVTV